MHIYFHTFHILRERLNAFNKYKTINYNSRKKEFYILNFIYDFSLKRLNIFNVIMVVIFFSGIEYIYKC